MKRIVAIVTVAAVVAAFCVGVFLLVDSDGPSAVTIGDDTISQDHVDDELRELANNDTLAEAITAAQAPMLSNTDGSTITADVSAGWLGLIVAQEFAARAVEDAGLEITTGDRDEGEALAVQSVGGQAVYDSLPDWFQRRLVDRWIPVAVLRAERAADPSPELQEFLASQCPSGRYVSHILVESEEEAIALAQELDAGADFAELAAEHSTDTGSAQQGGQLGCADGQSFVEPFATAAATQEPDVVSDPVTTEFGTHLILVSGEPPTELVLQAATDEVLGGARGRRVDIDPRYGEWDPANGQVIPPLPTSQPAVDAAPTG